MFSPHFVSETPLPYDESKKVVAHLDQETSIVMKKFEQVRGVHVHTSYVYSQPTSTVIFHDPTHPELNPIELIWVELHKHM